MTLEQKVGELFHVGFSGIDVTDELSGLVTDAHVGGVIYFTRNITSPAAVAAISEDLQELADQEAAPLALSVDEEGGSVTRITGGVHLPGHMAIGATGDPRYAREAGSVAGGQLADVGITMNLAPVLDVNVNPENPVIGSRSFGDDPSMVGRFGSAYIDGLQDQGVSACAKHFPGHGDTAVDSHLDLPVIDHNLNRLRQVELAPFERAIDHGVDSIMTAHVSFPAIEPEAERPATLSRAVLTQLLREELEFDGVIVTDCLEMDAIADDVGTVEGAIQAIEAGADILIVSHTPSIQRAAIDGVVDAVEAGRIAESRIDASVERSLALKHERSQDGPDAPFDPVAGRGVAHRIAAEAVTLFRNASGILPLETGAVTLIAFDVERLSGVVDGRAEAEPKAFVDQLRQHGFEVTTRLLAPGSALPPIPSERPTIVHSDDALQAPAQQTTVAELHRTVGELVVLAVNNPYDVRVLPSVATYLTCYDRSPACQRAAADVITGKREARGTPPVRVLPPDNQER